MPEYLQSIILPIRLAKLIVDTIIHGYALHSIYDWSIHLFGSIWSSVTHLLLHLGRSPQTKDVSYDKKYTTFNVEASGNQLSASSPASKIHPTQATALGECEITCEKEKTNNRYSYGELQKYLDDNY